MSNGYKAALARFEAAVRADAWKGAQHPGDHDAIEREYQAAKAALVTKLQYRKLAVELREKKVASTVTVAVTNGEGTELVIDNEDVLWIRTSNRQTNIRLGRATKARVEQLLYNLNQIGTMCS